MLRFGSGKSGKRAGLSLRERFSLTCEEGELSSQNVGQPEPVADDGTKFTRLRGEAKEKLDSLPSAQKHVWDTWAKERLKPRHKIGWLRQTLLPNRTRPFPWILMLINAIWTAVIVCIFEIPSIHTERLEGYFEDNVSEIMTMLGLLTFFLSIIISFRVNQAYSRWWEARILWGGMTNDCRDFAIKILAHVGDNGIAVKLCLWTCVTADLTRLRLRGKRSSLGLVEILADRGELSFNDLEMIESADHRVLSALYQMSRLLAEACKRRKVSQFMHLHLNDINNKFNTYLGSMERILTCPMPLGYTCIIRTAILGWMAILPFGLIPIFGYYSIPIDIAISYFICGLEDTAAELENPFGVDPNDLPLEHFTSNIRNNIFELLCKYEESQVGPIGPMPSPVMETARSFEGNDDGHRVDYE